MKKIRRPDHHALERLAALLGPKGYQDDREQIAPWLTDWRGIYSGNALAMLAPSCVAEVQAIVATASEFGIGIVPQGGNTSMVGGATPSEDGSTLLISLRRMNMIRKIDSAAGFAVAEAGVILSVLHDAAHAVGWRFPLSLGAKGSATIGGLVSTNAGGTQVLRFGTMRKLVLGLEAVMPDGTLFTSLAALKKDNRGYDLAQLLIGAEGTLGVVTAATLHLVPKICDRVVAWIGVDSPQDALSMMRIMERATGDAIESFEIMPGETLSLVLKHIPGSRNPLAGDHPWHVLIEYVVSTPCDQSADALFAPIVATQIETGMARDAVLSASEAQAEAFWGLRDSISEVERANGPAMQHDISVPINDMPAFMIDVAAAVESRFPGVIASAFGHWGYGNVLFHVRAPVGADPASWRQTTGYAASQFVYDQVTAAGGSISAEHGIGQMKRDELVRQSDPGRLAAMRAIKLALDPANIMNPGKLVPLASGKPSP